jgi:lipid II:glycine glycyltransferase (peptidoglycan interpeptide bridge formation enzyme)
MPELRLLPTHDPLAYSDVVRQAAVTSALQGWGYGEARATIGYAPSRFLLERGGETIGAMQLLRKPLPGGLAVLYAPRGPVLCDAGNMSLELDELARAVRKIARVTDVSIKIEPPFPVAGDAAIPETLGLWKRVETDQPEHTIAVDLRLSEKELLENCHQMTRRNIKTGIKRGTVAARDESFEDFWTLFEATNIRAKLGQYPKSYYTTMLEQANQHGAEAYIVLARNEGKALAGGFMLGMGKGAYYLYGGSVRDDRLDAEGKEIPDVKAPTLFYWQAMMDAKARGYEFFDLWGIPRVISEEKHSIGIYKMKENFGGKALWYPAYSYDLTPLAGLVRKALRWKKDRNNLQKRGTREDVL